MKEFLGGILDRNTREKIKEGEMIKSNAIGKNAREAYKEGLLERKAGKILGSFD